MFCPPRTIEQFVHYYTFLVNWNRHTNLTALTDFEDYAVKHVLDSLLPTRFFSAENMSLADVGSGAGFPGIPLKLYCPSVDLSLLDAAAKRVRFLEACCQHLNVKAEILQIRAEDAGRGNLRERFDRVCARAVASLPVLVEYCLPLVRPGGQFVALKGPRASDELDFAQGAIVKLGGEIGAVHEYELMGTERRTIIIINKTQATPEKYPRKPGIPGKKPLR